MEESTPPVVDKVSVENEQNRDLEGVENNVDSNPTKADFTCEHELSRDPVYMDPYKHHFEWQLGKYCREVLTYKLEYLMKTTSLVSDLIQTLPKMNEKDLDLHQLNPVKYETLDEELENTRGKRLNSLFYTSLGDLSFYRPLDDLISDISYAYGVLSDTFIGVVDYVKGVNNPRCIKCVMFLVWMNTSITFEIDCNIILNEPLASNLSDILIGFNNFILHHFGKCTWSHIRNLQLKREEEEKEDEDDEREKNNSAGKKEMEKVQMPNNNKVNENANDGNENI